MKNVINKSTTTFLILLTAAANVVLIGRQFAQGLIQTGLTADADAILVSY